MKELIQEINDKYISKENNVKRHNAYKLYVKKIGGLVKKEEWDGKGQTATLNPKKCAINGIRKQWPDKDNKYTGYKTNLERAAK